MLNIKVVTGSPRWSTKNDKLRLAAVRRLSEKKYYDSHTLQVLEKNKRWNARHPGVKAVSGRNWDLVNYERSKFIKIRAKSGRLGIPFNLTMEDFIVPERCPVFGTLLVSPMLSGRHASMNAPSIDRVIPSKGYVKGNVRIISYRANLLKSDATLDELKKIVSYIEDHNAQNLGPDSESSHTDSQGSGNGNSSGLVTQRGPY